MMRRITTALFAAALLLLLLPRVFSPLAIFCALHLSRPLTALLASISAHIPFPVAGWFIVIAAAAVSALALISRSHRWAGRWVAALLAALLFAYSAMWGALYACPGQQPGELTPQSLRRLCGRLIDEANDALSCGVPEADLPCLFETGCVLMRAQMHFPSRPAKATRFPRLFTTLGLAGFYFPLTGEAIVNPQDCPDTLPFTICHELAHQAGIAREGEANYLAFLACESGGNALFRYSACFTTLLYAMKSLRTADQAGWLQALSRMSPALYRRFVKANGLSGSHTSGVRGIQQAVTDAFLRLSGDSDGIASYERVLPLLAAHWGLDSETAI